MNQWMIPGETAEPPYMAVFRTAFCSKETTVLKFRYSADERARFFLDGHDLGEGPERGTPERWFYGEIECSVEPGEHVLTAQLLAFGEKMTAYAQMSVRHGLWVEDRSGLLTGEWESQVMGDCVWNKPGNEWFSYPHIHAGPGFNREALSGKGGIWHPVKHVEDARTLHAPVLPRMRHEEVKNYVRIGDVFLFDDYMCVYPEFVFSGTGTARVRWAEPGIDPDRFDAAFMTGSKPGMGSPYFSGEGEVFELTGGTMEWKDFWWHAGRTLEVTLTGDARLESARFFRTGYPYRRNVSLEVPGDERLTRLLKRSFRTLESCTFETLMDCPYYEQLQYIGDSRIDALVLYQLGEDRRPVEKALRQFSEGQQADGAIVCRYPAKDTKSAEKKPGDVYTVHIPSFVCFYVMMVHDYAAYHGNPDLIAELVPPVRKAVNYLKSCLTSDGVLSVPGWNFIDWLSNWKNGVPPRCENGCGCTLNWLYVLALKNAADLERGFGDVSAVSGLLARAEELERNIVRVYWNEARGMFAESAEQDYYSEHAQVFALLAGGREEVIPALQRKDLDLCGIYFSFYYLEACRLFGLDDLFRERMEKYLAAADHPDLRTMPEQFPDDPWRRSDCHAWSSHILYFQFLRHP